MAQTRRKTKHRGNAAGMVESRGRTGRKPTAEEKKGGADAARKPRPQVDRRDRPPTWRGAFTRAIFAAVMMVAILLIFKLAKPAAAAALFPFVLLMYVPISYYTDRFIYQRRLRQKAAAKRGTR